MREREKERETTLNFTNNIRQTITMPLMITITYDNDE